MWRRGGGHPGRNKQPLLQPQEVVVCAFQILYKRYFKDCNLFSTLLRAQGIIHTSDTINRYPEGVHAHIACICLMEQKRQKKQIGLTAQCLLGIALSLILEVRVYHFSPDVP